MLVQFWTIGKGFTCAYLYNTGSSEQNLFRGSLLGLPESRPLLLYTIFFATYILFLRWLKLVVGNGKSQCQPWWCQHTLTFITSDKIKCLLFFLCEINIKALDFNTSDKINAKFTLRTFISWLVYRIQWRILQWWILHHGYITCGEKK